MFKVKLKKDGIFGNIYEQDLLDGPSTEFIIVIRKLKALANSLSDGFIRISKTNICGQAYSAFYGVWFYHNEWEEYNEKVCSIKKERDS